MKLMISGPSGEVSDSLLLLRDRLTGALRSRAYSVAILTAEEIASRTRVVAEARRLSDLAATLRAYRALRQQIVNEGMGF